MWNGAEWRSDVGVEVGPGGPHRLTQGLAQEGSGEDSNEKDLMASSGSSSSIARRFGTAQNGRTT